MKKKIKRLTSKELSDYPISDLVNGCCFRIEEVSPGGYLVEGKDPWGRVVSRMGSDPDILVTVCRNDIKEMFPDLKI